MKHHFASSSNTGSRDGEHWVAIVGNPNCGKTAIFNLLTGLNQKVSNYPGITVEKKEGLARTDDGDFRLLDLPGTYSLSAESFDEEIVSEQIDQWAKGIEPPSVIISVVDATNLGRNLYLTSQLQDLNIPIVIALNMVDQLEDHTQIDADKLAYKMGVAAVIPLSAKLNEGLDNFKNAVVNARKGKQSPLDSPPWMDSEMVSDLKSTEHNGYVSARFGLAQSMRNKIQSGTMEGDQEAILRYRWIDDILSQVTHRGAETPLASSRSEQWDKILTHQWGGPLIFVGILYFIFQSIFTWATVPMDMIQLGMDNFSTFVVNNMPEGMLRDILVEGIIGGVGAIVIFLPQILILSFFLTLLEDTGYMARVAFMLDKGMTKMGLHGKSVLPLMSGYACAIPGIMSTRTIDSWKERLVTILILPLMSCSARLPVYTLLIGAFIPSVTVGGYFNLQGLTLVLMYFLGTAVALILAKVFSKWVGEKSSSSFIMELPPYRAPIPKSVLRHVFIRGKLFLVNAGKVIMAISIVLWFLASFPKVDNPNSDVNPIQHSYAGQIGHAMEPVIRPLGFDWKIGIGLLTSFAAREVMVSTMATIYNVEDAGEETVNLREAMQTDVHPETGAPTYTPLVALALMVFYVFAAQCMATFAVVRQETNSWKWPMFMVVYMTALAYFGAMAVYQGGKLLGFS